MPSSLDLDDLERRPQRYWHIDGIPELVLGAVWTVWGAALLVGQALPPGPAWRVYWLIVPVVLVLSGVAANRLTRRLKMRLTYPRTGYMELPPPRPAVRATAAVVAVAASALVAALIAKGEHGGAQRATPIVMGLLFSLAFLVAAVRQHEPSLLALAGVALMLGVAATALGAGVDGQSWLIAGLGLACAAVGGWRLRRYLRSHPLEGTR